MVDPRDITNILPETRRRRHIRKEGSILATKVVLLYVVGCIVAATVAALIGVALNLPLWGRLVLGMGAAIISATAGSWLVDRYKEAEINKLRIELSRKKWKSR